MGHRRSPKGPTWGSTEVRAAGARLGPCRRGSLEGRDLPFRLQGDAEGCEAGAEEISFVLQKAQCRPLRCLQMGKGSREAPVLEEGPGVGPDPLTSTQYFLSQTSARSQECGDEHHMLSSVREPEPRPEAPGDGAQGWPHGSSPGSFLRAEEAVSARCVSRDQSGARLHPSPAQRWGCGRGAASHPPRGQG